MQIGTPPRDFLILMDSGSADFWVGAENCQSDAGGGCVSRLLSLDMFPKKISNAQSFREITNSSGPSPVAHSMTPARLSLLHTAQVRFQVILSRTASLSPDSRSMLILSELPLRKAWIFPLILHPLMG